MLCLLYGKQFCSYYSYYSRHYESANVDIFVVKDYSVDFKSCTLDDVGKCMVLPYADNFWIALPLIHQII